MTSGTSPATGQGIVDAVLSSFSDAWNRMTWLLFLGPHASIATWAWWGLILLLSGATNLGSGGGGSNVSGDGDLSDLTGVATPTIAAGWLTITIASFACVGLIVYVAWLYVRSRFRFVAIDGVMSGEPRIRDAWPRTSAVGIQYFIFELIVSLACLVIVIPVILAWIPVIASASSGSDVELAAVAFPVVTTLVVLIPLALAKALLDWFVYDITLPLAWLVEQDYWAGLRRSVRLLGSNLGAVLVFLLARIVVGIVGGIAFFCAACLTCVLWIWPAIAAAGLILISLPFPPVLIVTAPLAIAFGIVAGWIIVTAGAPILLLYRGWSIAFVGRLDPELPRFELPTPPPAPAPPASPQGTGDATAPGSPGPGDATERGPQEPFPDGPGTGDPPPA